MLNGKASGPFSSGEGEAWKNGTKKCYDPDRSAFSIYAFFRDYDRICAFFRRYKRLFRDEFAGSAIFTLISFRT